MTCRVLGTKLVDDESFCGLRWPCMRPIKGRHLSIRQSNDTRDSKVQNSGQNISNSLYMAMSSCKNPFKLLLYLSFKLRWLSGWGVGKAAGVACFRWRVDAPLDDVLEAVYSTKAFGLVLTRVLFLNLQSQLTFPPKLAILSCRIFAWILKCS